MNTERKAFALRNNEKLLAEHADIMKTLVNVLDKVSYL